MIELAMEGMSEIPHREPETVVNTERKIELMKGLFPKNAEITNIGEMN